MYAAVKRSDKFGVLASEVLHAQPIMRSSARAKDAPVNGLVRMSAGLSSEEHLTAMMAPYKSRCTWTGWRRGGKSRPYKKGNTRREIS